MHCETFVQFIRRRVTYKQHDALFYCSLTAVELEPFLLLHCLKKCTPGPEIAGQRRRQTGLIPDRSGIFGLWNRKCPGYPRGFPSKGDALNLREAWS